MDTIDRVDSRDAAAESHLSTKVEAQTQKTHERTENRTESESRHVMLSWLQHDTPFIVMLLLALVGVVFRLSVLYWFVLTPVFAVVSIVAGWSHFKTGNERLGLVYRLTLDWCALLLAIYLLFNSGIQGVLNANATSLAMMTLLALGTFVAGVQARVWQISVVGSLLFLAVPGLGWLDQSPLLLTSVAILIVALTGFAWWVSQKWRGPADKEPRRSVDP
jgi:maltodextrin utilization protein YvdJ